MNKIKKLIFLDIDGVMNSEVDYLLNPNAPEQAMEISNRCMKLLNVLIEETGAEVVISSTWRNNKTIEELQTLFDINGFVGKIIGKTPRYDDTTIRGNEILGWIKNNEVYIGERYHEYDTYVIFDDDTDMLYWQKDNYLKVDGYVGLTPTLIYKATWILNKYDKRVE